MLHDVLISATLTLIVIAPMAVSAWLEGREADRESDRQALYEADWLV